MKLANFVLAAITAAQARGWASRSSRARRNAHMARVMVRVRVTSGINTRVNRKRPMHVESANPLYNPAVSENAQAPMRAVNQHRQTATKAMGKRAAQSCTPNSLKNTAIIQYFIGDFSR